MKLYIWEGNLISSAYHDDGTLVVLANSPEHARQVVRETRDRVRRHQAAMAPIKKAIREEIHAFAMAHGGYSDKLWQTEEGKAFQGREGGLVSPEESLLPDGTEEALSRDPDRVVELDKPTIVAFNGGGYD